MSAGGRIGGLIFALVLLIFGVIRPLYSTNKALFFKRNNNNDNTYKEKTYKEYTHAENSQKKDNNKSKQSDSFKNEKTYSRESKLKDDTNYYSLLNINSNSTIEEIKVAYKNEIKKYHPDKVEHLGDEFKKLAEQKTKEINEAYNYFKKKYNF